LLIRRGDAEARDLNLLRERSGLDASSTMGKTRGLPGGRRRLCFIGCSSILHETSGNREAAVRAARDSLGNVTPLAHDSEIGLTVLDAQ
jgi:hypothetical protein